VVVFHRFDGNLPAIVLYNVVTQVKSDTRSFASCLGSEEGVEDLLKDVLFDAVAIIADDDDRLLGVVGDTQNQLGLVVSSFALSH
jgi:hypothetical protein